MVSSVKLIKVIKLGLASPLIAGLLLELTALEFTLESRDPWELVNLAALTTAVVLGILMSIASIRAGGSWSYFTALTIYLIAEFLGRPRPFLVTASVAGLMAYVLVDNLENVFSGGATYLSRVKLVTLSEVGFTLMKLAAPLTLSAFVSLIYSSILGISLPEGSGARPLLLFFRSFIGKIVFLAVITAVAIYITRMAVESLILWVSPSQTVVSELVKREEIAAERFQLTLRSLGARGGMITMMFLLFYPPVNEAITILLTGSGIGPGIQLSVIKFLVAFTFSAVLWKVSDFLLGMDGWKALVGSATLMSLVTASLYVISTYYGFPLTSPELSELLVNSYYAFYEDLVKLLEFLTYIVGVTP